MIGKIVFLLLLFLPIGLTPIFADTPKDSFYFNGLDEGNYILKGTSTITNQENPSYQLNGIGDYMILNSNLPQKLNDFSISIWVKPDFKVGSPATLSTISQSNTFNLSINNDQIDKNFATFSVYDGIKWHHVSSKSEIKDNWTHLAATYSDEIISIFVNGVEENSVKVDGYYSFTYTHGIAKQNSNNYLNSESKILVGAFTPLLRADGVVKNNFSGQIDDVLLFDTALLQENISTLYQNDRLTPKGVEQKIKIVSSPKGIVNQYGFTINPENPNDQKIETVSAEGYKIRKQFSGNSPTINETPNLTKELEDKNSDSVSLKTTILDNEKKSVTKISKPIVGTGKTVLLCHVPSNDIDNPFTITVFSSSVNIHLNHGDILGECIN